jgi:hypothetical protein
VIEHSKLSCLKFVRQALALLTFIFCTNFGEAMKHLILSGLALGLLVSTAAAAGMGLTVRLHGGLDGLSGLDGVNDGITSLNTYFGKDGSWVADAQGENADTGGWAPWLRVEELNNRPDMGITVEKELPLSAFTRVIFGVEASFGNIGTSGLFEFQPPNSNLEASVWNEEHIEVSSFQLTSRYSLKDPNLPLWAHAGLGLGLAQIDATATYLHASSVFNELDPMYGEIAPIHTIDAAYDGSALTARLFVGFEYMLGSNVFQLDLGYNHMDFGELDGNTTTAFRDNFGVMQEVEVTNVPDTRYEFVPVISYTLQDARDDAIWTAITGLPPLDEPVDLHNPNAIEYDMSGGYVRLSYGYRF